MKNNPSFASCLKKQEHIKILFKDCSTAEAKYQKLIDLGRQLPLFSDEYKTPENIVSGCQSVMYLHSHVDSSKNVYFSAYSEALISAGLAALLIKAYDGESPEVILKCPPLFLDEIGLQGALSPSRSNGLASLFLKMKQKALQFL